MTEKKSIQIFVKDWQTLKNEATDRRIHLAELMEEILTKEWQKNDKSNKK